MNSSRGKGNRYNNATKKLNNTFTNPIFYEIIGESTNSSSVQMSTFSLFLFKFNYYLSFKLTLAFPL